MSRRTSKLFRGSELPRLLFMVVIVLAGWPMYLLFARPQADPKPPAPAVTAEMLTPIVPDNAVEFQSLVDYKLVLTRESAAYALLLARARETSPAELASKARRDVFWTHLMERPKLYRGVPVHFEGVARKVLTYEVAPSMSPKGRLFEAWIYSDENTAFPYVVMFEDAPKGLAIGHELFLRVTVDGYFMKLLGYRAGDKNRAAPMLVGRITWTPEATAAPSPMVEIRDALKQNGLVLLIVLLVGYLVFRVLFQVHKALNPVSDRTPFTAPSEGAPPEEVADWLRNLTEELPETEDDESRPTRD